MILGLPMNEGPRAMIDRLTIAIQFNIGIDRALNLRNIFKHLVIPCYIHLLDLVCIPYACGRVIASFASTYMLQTQIMRLSFPTYAALKTLWYHLSKTFMPTIRQVCQHYYESFFIVETQLTNRGN